MPFMYQKRLALCGDDGLLAVFCIYRKPWKRPLSVFGIASALPSTEKALAFVDANLR